ncbi:MAG: hypothetical protein CME61_02605 [Halobacteriovoraceae bacterium]|nr:hypothetical protein [Halobacteriovoraceae bacterium]
MKLLNLTLLLFTTSALANFGDTIGVAPENISLGGQASLHSISASAGLFHPSSVGFETRNQFSFSISNTSFNFSEIKNIVVENDTTSQSGQSFGNVSTDYESISMGQAHGVVSIPKLETNLAFSIFAPLLYIAKFDSGDPQLPEYVMYRSRPKRMSAQLSLTRKVNDNVALALGAQVGFKLEADIEANASLNGTNFGSSARAKANIFPKVAFLGSASYFNKDHRVSFTLKQGQEMTAKASVTGQTTDPRIIFDLTSESLSYFEPHQLRATYSFKALDWIEITTGVKYEIWSDFTPPTLKLIQEASVLSSDNYEVISTKNTLSPSLGLKIDVQKWSILTGVSLNESPLDSSYTGAGNSIDSSSKDFSAGVIKRTNLFSTEIAFTGAIKYRKLEEKTVNKETGQENGSNGLKIGAPGYDIGGDITNVAIGLQIKF